MGSVGAPSDDDELNINPPAPCQIGKRPPAPKHQNPKENRPVITRESHSAFNKAPLDVQGRGRYSFRCFRSACFGLFLAGFGLFWAIFAHWGGLGAHLDARRGALLTALADVPN